MHSRSVTRAGRLTGSPVGRQRLGSCAWERAFECSSHRLLAPVAAWTHAVGPGHADSRGVTSAYVLTTAGQTCGRGERELGGNDDDLGRDQMGACVGSLLHCSRAIDRAGRENGLSLARPARERRAGHLITTWFVYTNWVAPCCWPWGCSCLPRMHLKKTTRQAQQQKMGMPMASSRIRISAPSPPLPSGAAVVLVE